MSALSEAMERIRERVAEIDTVGKCVADDLHDDRPRLRYHELRIRLSAQVPALIKACEILAKAAQAVEDGFDCRGAHCPGCMMAAALSAAAEALEKEK